jgi:hypothetical protein
VDADSYQTKMARHLAAYRRRRLGLPEETKGTYARPGGAPRAYGHILPRELKWLNIPESFRREVREHVRASPRIKLHKFFHHLNSSQAFALSTFFPYLTRKRMFLAQALDVMPILRWDFEAIPDADENTHVDVWWTSPTGVMTYCEVKLSETAFGTAEDDPRHLRKLEQVYAPVLASHLDPELLEGKEFFKNYQILRNLWLAARSGHERDKVLFLLPKANVRPVEQLDKILAKVRMPLKGRVKVVFVEALLETLVSDRSPTGLGWYAEMLREKYVPE